MTWGLPNNVLYGMAMLLVIGSLCVLYAYYVANRYAKDKSNQRGTTHVTPVGGNIFLDLGFEPEEAEAMLQESRRRIAAKLQGKSVKAEIRAGS